MPRIGLDFALDSLGGGLGGGILCDFTTFYNGVSLVTDSFVNGVPGTGPIRIDTAGATNDAITATINFDPAVDETFSINTTLLDNTFSADVLFTLIDVAGTAYMRVQYIESTGKLYMECYDGTTFSYMDSDTVILIDSNYDIGFNLSGAAATKLITLTIDGVSQTDTASLNFTGVTFDKIVVATSGNFGAKLKLLLYNVNSIQLGDTDFVGRLPAQTDPYGNQFLSDSVVPVVYTLFNQSPLTEYYPYYALGFGWPNAYYVTDTYCGDIVGFSRYTDGVTPVDVPYVRDEFGIEYPAVGNLILDGVIMLDNGTGTAVDYANECSIGYQVIADNDVDLDALINISSSTLTGSILVLIQASGIPQLQVRDNIGNTFIVIASATTNVKGALHTVGFDIEENGANHDFYITVDGVREGSHLNVVTSDGIVFDKIALYGTGSAPLEAQVIDYRQNFAPPWGAAYNRYWDFVGRLKLSGATQDEFIDTVINEIMTVSDVTAVYPNLGATYYLDEDFPNA